MHVPMWILITDVTAQIAMAVWLLRPKDFGFPDPDDHRTLLIFELEDRIDRLQADNEILRRRIGGSARITEDMGIGYESAIPDPQSGEYD